MSCLRVFGKRASATAAVLLSMLVPAYAQLNVVSDNNATNLVNALLSGGGIPFSNESLTGGTDSAGLFSNGLAVGLGIDEGVLLSSGSVLDAPGPNVVDNTSTSLIVAGDADLDALAGVSTNDATVLQFDFTANEGDDLLFRYVFASEEYNEYVGQQYNDAFGFFLDGGNIALAPSVPAVPVTVNNVNGTNTPALYNDNDPGDLGTPTPFDIEYDGFTTVFTAARQDLSAGTHTIKLAIADASDDIYDSTVFIEGEFMLVENDPPTADLDGPYFADGSTTLLTLDASGSTDDGNLAPLTYAWDLDNDGFFDDASTGTTPSLDIPNPYSFFGGPGIYDVGVQVFDGQFNDAATSTVTVVPEPASLVIVVCCLPFFACFNVIRLKRRR